jgi:hypothetical protein
MAIFGDSQKILRGKLQVLHRQWIRDGLPTRQQLENVAIELELWKKNNRVAGLWDPRPCMLTATLDDGMGVGLAIIERYAAILGFYVIHLGLLQKKETIVDACLEHRPDFLGLTVLQLDSEDDLAYIGSRLPQRTKLIAGGPVFAFDPEMAGRCHICFVARDLAHFIDFLLDYYPG